VDGCVIKLKKEDIMSLYIKNNVIREQRVIEIVKDGYRTFNPSHEMLIADGWEVYTPPTPSQPEVTPEQMYKDRVIELVRAEYSVDDELAILRQRDTKVDEFNSYNTFVEECKVTARREIYGDELI
jgi:hypothetical protein